MLCLLAILLATPTAPSPETYAVTALTRLLRVHGYGEPVLDRDLSAAAVELAARHVEAAPKDAHEAASALRFVLSKHGVADAHVTPFTLRHANHEDLDAHLPSLVARIEPRLAPTHFGVGARRDGDAWLTTILLVHRAVALERALPRRSNPGAVLRISGPLLEGYFQPRVLLSSPGSSQVSDVFAGTGERRVEAEITLDRGPGAYDVEIVADSPNGPVVLVNHRVYAGVQPPARPQPQPAGKVEGDPAHALFELINARRARAGVRALRWHRTLSEVAEAHAREMSDANSMRHVSPELGPLTSRLKAHGLRPAAVAENLALADSPEAAMAAFLDSPGHKRNLFLRPISHVGIGVVGRYYAVEMAGLPPR